MPVSSYRRNLPELIRSSDETYLRGLAALSRSSGSRLSDRYERLSIESSVKEPTLESSRYSLRYKSHSFTSSGLGLSRKAEEESGKRHESGSSAISSRSSTSSSSASGSPTRARAARSPTRARAARSPIENTKCRTTNGISSPRQCISPQGSRESSLSSRNKCENERVGSLVSSPKWSRIKETFESNKPTPELSSNSKLHRNHSHSTSSLPVISSPHLYEANREQALSKSTRVPTYRHSTIVQNNSVKSSETEMDFSKSKLTVSKRTGVSRLPTLSTKLDSNSAKERLRRCSDSSLLNVDNSLSCFQESKISSRNKLSSQFSESDDEKCLYSRIGTKSNISKVRKSSGAGLSLSKSGEISFSESKDDTKNLVVPKSSTTKFDPDSFEEKVKALRKRIASTAREYDSILKDDSPVNKETKPVSRALTRSSSLKYECIPPIEKFTESNLSRQNVQIEDFFKVPKFLSSSELTKEKLSTNFVNTSLKKEPTDSVATRLKRESTDEVITRMKKEKSLVYEENLHERKCISLRSEISISSRGDQVDVTSTGRRSLPKTLDLESESAPWKKSNNGAWTKMNQIKETSTGTAKSRVALLAQQFNDLGENNIDGSKNNGTVIEKYTRSISVPMHSNRASTKGVIHDVSPPKYQTTQVFKERCLSLPSSTESSINSFKNSSPISESSTEDIDSTKQALSNGRKHSLVKQVVQSFEEHLASSNSSESGSSRDNTPTSAGHSNNKNSCSFNVKSPIRQVEKQAPSSQSIDKRSQSIKNSQAKATYNSKSNKHLYDTPQKSTESKKSPGSDERKNKPFSSKTKNLSKTLPLSRNSAVKRPDLPPPRKPITPKRPLYINAPCTEDSLLAELEQWLVQKYDHKETTTSNIPNVYTTNAVPNQSFLWKELGPKLSNESQNDLNVRNSPKMDGGEQRASGNYYSMPFPHPNSPIKKFHDDHIYMEASFIKPEDRRETKHIDNGSSCDSDEGWVDVSDTELDGYADSPKNCNMGARLRVRTKSISSQAGSRKSWRESVRELAAGPPSCLLDDETWNHKDYQDIMIWESVEGDDSSLSSTSDHFYEALYEEIVDNGRSADNKDGNSTMKKTLGYGLKSIDESPDVSPQADKVDHVSTTATKYDNISGLKKRNSFIETSSTTPVEESSHLKRNWSLTKKDIHLELDAKLGKNKPHKSANNISDEVDMSKSKPEISSPAVPLVSTSKRKTLIKFILRQKNGNNTAAPITLPGSPTTTSAYGNKKRTRKKGSMFYVRWSTVNRDTRQKSQSENDITCENQSEVDSGNGTSSERLDTSTSPTNVATIKRRPSGIRRPSSPPPLPPISGATVVRSHSGTKSLEILRPPLSRLPLDEKTKSLDSVIVSADGNTTSESNNRESSNKPTEQHLKRSGSNSERSSCSSTGTRASSSSSSSYVPGDSPFSLSPKCRSSVASSHSSHSGAGSYINVDDLASKPTSLSLPITSRDSDSLCSYLLINADLKEPLKSPFEEEPLYQFYHKDAKQRATLWQSMATMEEDDHYYREEFSDDFSDTESEDDKLKDDAGASQDGPKSPGLCTLKALYPPSNGSTIPSAMDLLRQEGGGGQRTLWCEVPEVRNSGILEKISAQDRKIQEAMFEVITSEASYLKSLNILMEHFMQCPEFSDDFSVNCVLGRRERHILFSDVAPVRDVSARLLADLERRWQENIVLTNICDILYEHASKFFNVYVKYCANQVYQDRILKELKATRPDFIDVLHRLESNPLCQGLDMLSFLMLPMQRITRMPLLVDAIYHRLSPESQYHSICKLTLAMLNKVVAECNEGARRMERMEEMLVISRQLDFRDCKSIPLISASRWLVKKGELTKVSFDNSNSKRTFGRASKFSKSSVYFFLFTDLLVVGKKKNEESYVVLDYCPRNMVQVFTLEESNIQIPGKLPEGLRNLFQLTMLQNNEFKTIEMILSCPLESDRTRWMEAVTPPISENPDEKIYEQWDCPQVQCIYPYFAQQPDELSLEESDVVNVLRKMPDGWYEGERLRDGLRGWFPASFSVEIISSHIRARNLRQRYRLLMLSQAYVEEQRKAFMNQTKVK